MKRKANSKWQIVNSSKKGFTLVELLVSSAIFVAIGTIIVVILSMSFKVSQKTQVTLSLKTNGSNALSQIANSIKYAKSLDDPIDCVTPVTQSQITITSSFDGGKTVFSCPADISSPIASNGAALLDTSNISVRYCSFSCSQTSSTGAPTIGIYFALSDGVSNNPSAAVPFHTSVIMRNFTK